VPWEVRASVMSGPISDMGVYGNDGDAVSPLLLLLLFDNREVELPDRIMVEA